MNELTEFNKINELIWMNWVELNEMSWVELNEMNWVELNDKNVLNE